jgi:hypothetical protein
MNMKVMTAKEAKNSFGIFIDTAQVEPVLVTRRKRPIGVFLSIQEIGNIPELKKRLLNYMNEKVKNPLLAMLGANKENRAFVSVKEADKFILELRNEWK